MASNLDLTTVRNIGIAAHIDAGKTTTTERILYYSGRTHRMGEVDDGTTTTDFDEQEQKRGITIYSAAVSLPWKGFTINLIDTPGHVDFTAEVERSLRVLDGMVAVFDAREGVEAQSETVWRQADRYTVPRMCFINKMDRLGADFENALTSLRERLHTQFAVIQWPIGAGSDFTGLIDLIEMKAVYFRQETQGVSIDVVDIPPDLSDLARRERRALLETLSDSSEFMMERYVADAPITPAEVRQALRQATMARSVVPVLCGSALRYIGVQRLMDAVCDFLPSPLDLPPVRAADMIRAGVYHELRGDLAEPVAALVFKIVAERPVDLYFLRVYSGTLKSNSRLLNANTGEKENVSRLYRMFAKRRDQVDEAVAGEIVAVIGPRNALTGHTLCDPRRGVKLETITFPDTVVSVSIEPRSSKDRDRLFEALRQMSRQDPTLAVTVNDETGQTLLSGMGELHLEVVVQRLRNEMNLDVGVGKPRVSYREAVTQPGEGIGRFERNIGGRDHFAAVCLRLEPMVPESDTSKSTVMNQLDADSLPLNLRAPLETGIRDASQSGILGGYPVINWRAQVVSVELRPELASELAFENAGRIAFYDAMKNCGPVIMEPIMYTEVTTPEEYFGAIMTDLNSRNALVRETMIKGTGRIIHADVPLSQLFGYVTRLRSLSQGRATASMTPSRYAEVSPEESKRLVG